MQLDLSSWDPDAAVAPKRRRAVSIGIQQTISFKEEANSYRHYIIGGWPEYSQYIDPATVPLCRHEHGPVGEDLARRLKRKCLFMAFFSRRCLTSAWREFPAGAEALTYGSIENGAKFDLWIREVD